MKLWGKVMSGFLLAMAVGFVGVAIIAPPELRPSMATTAVFLIAAGLLGVPALVRLFISFTGDEELLADGAAADATIVSLTPTGWRYNRFYPITRFQLRVEPDGAAYSVDLKQAVDPAVLATLAPGVTIRVRVDRSDRHRVVIDTREMARGD